MKVNRIAAPLLLVALIAGVAFAAFVSFAHQGSQRQLALDAAKSSRHGV